MVREGFGHEAVAQPLVVRPPPSPRPLRDWTARTRATALETLRYTRFVMAMKQVLPIAALAIVASVIAYSVIPRRPDGVSLTYQRIGAIRDDLVMIKPRLSGTDDRGNPFVITAAKAVQDVNNRHRASLRQVEADMQIDNRNWLNARAANGFFDMDARTIRLGGGIALFTDSGYELHTDSADVDLNNNVIEGQSEVKGHGPLGSLRADRFHVDRLKRQLRLIGHVRMTMYPKEVRR
jgi:lipopolysaccharide export system protein LptC